MELIANPSERGKKETPDREARAGEREVVGKVHSFVGGGRLTDFPRHSPIFHSLRACLEECRQRRRPSHRKTFLCVVRRALCAAGFVNDDCDDVVCEQADTDEAIVAAVQDRGDEVSDDDTDEEDRTPELSSRDALDYVSKLKLFCAQNLSEKALQHIIAVEDEMVHNAVKARRQTKITAFFH
ncbi:hypothetical protein HPB52_010540 [Rhipicephalus sanguineus]|uniref:Uncharacterized protein n=1 Tax=Rhipicephalus sanguineus TaxID=34632 RepID=A0A9D4PC96_RHISA|nr:hypothetical protein HPB52_010540 [Rhipicephalus sanguineus]